MALLFLTFGPTHSGKTTFGETLRAKVGESARFIHLDNDLIDAFLKANFNNLRTDKAILASKTPENPDLRLLIPQLITGYALKEGYSAIVTAAHPWRVIRQSYYEIARKNNAEIVLLIFRIDDSIALQRINQSQRPSTVLDISPHGAPKSFGDLYHNQKRILQEPDESERNSVSRVFEVDQQNTDQVLTKAFELFMAQQHSS